MAINELSVEVESISFWFGEWERLLCLLTARHSSKMANFMAVCTWLVISWALMAACFVPTQPEQVLSLAWYGTCTAAIVPGST